MEMRPIVADWVAWSVCLSVGRSVTILSRATTAEPIEMPFARAVDSGGPHEPCIRWCPDLPMRRDNCEGGNFTCTANGWLKEHQQILVYNEIHALEKRKCISAVGLKLCWKVTKYDIHIMWLTVLVYEFLNAPRALSKFRHNTAHVVCKHRTPHLPLCN